MVNYEAKFQIFLAGLKAGMNILRNIRYIDLSCCGAEILEGVYKLDHQL